MCTLATELVVSKLITNLIRKLIIYAVIIHEPEQLASQDINIDVLWIEAACGNVTQLSVNLAGQLISAQYDRLLYVSRAQQRLLCSCQEQ
jgi:hypothetical protein